MDATAQMGGRRIPAREAAGGRGHGPNANGGWRCQRPCRGARGAFTLIELLVSIVILATGIVAVLRAYESSVVAMGEAREVLYGTMLAAEQLAGIESGILVGDPPPATASGAFDGDFENYRWSFEAHRVAAPGDVVRADEEREDRVSLYTAEIAVWREGRLERQVTRTYLRY